MAASIFPGGLCRRRSALESIPDLTALGEEEARLLLAALVKDYVQMKASDLEQETGGSRSHGVGSSPSPHSQAFSSLSILQTSATAQKRACNTATCASQRLAGLLSRSGGVVKDNFVPTNVGAQAFGRRRRDFQA
ncbi:calcitonin peptide 2-like [Marmota monax]|uniref:Calcitonin peptide 2-like n=1 Tax=Marmota monax TaxID=9995 RepID=A0A834QTL6_MARMO|nr:calcitonin peptide 2-like [Marmota monax]